MAWLLRNRKHEDDHAGMGRLASSENPDVYLETMEAAKNEGEESDETWTPGLARPRSCLLPKSILALRKTRQRQYSHIQ